MTAANYWRNAALVAMLLVNGAFWMFVGCVLMIMLNMIRPSHADDTAGYWIGVGYAGAWRSVVVVCASYYARCAALAKAAELDAA